MRPTFAAVPLLLLLTACSANNFFSQASPFPPLGTPPSFPAFVSPYHAFGDSITAGATLTDPSTQAYPILTGQAKNLTTLNMGHGGDLGCDLPGFTLFPHQEEPTLAAPLHYSLIIGTNDVDFYGTGPHESDFNLCQQALIGWLALPAEFKTRANSPAVITSGPGTFLTADNLPTWTTAAQGASLSFPLTLPAPGPVYVWYRITYGNSGAFTWSLDQGPASTAISSAQALPQHGNHGFASALALLRIPSLPAGTHILTFTQSTPGAAGMGLLAVGIVPPPAQPGLSRILVGTVPRQWNQGAGSACVVTDSPCYQYTLDTLANVALFATDGLNVQAFESRKYTTGTAADMTDNLHPNALGQQEIAHALTDAF